MKLLTIIIIIAIAIMAFAYFYPDQFQNTKDNILNKKDEIQETATNTVKEITSTTNQTEINETENTTTEINTTQEIELTETCQRTQGAYPDYYGTVYWGQTCKESQTPDKDCVIYAPTTYPGSIDLNTETGTPPINCCLTDGKCRWTN